ARRQPTSSSVLGAQTCASSPKSERIFETSSGASLPTLPEATLATTSTRRMPATPTLDNRLADAVGGLGLHRGAGLAHRLAGVCGGAADGRLGPVGGDGQLLVDHAAGAGEGAVVGGHAEQDGADRRDDEGQGHQHGVAASPRALVLPAPLI